MVTKCTHARQFGKAVSGSISTLGGFQMSFAARWFTVALLLGCGICAYAASPETREGTLTVDGQPYQDLTRIAAIRLHLQDGDFRIVGGDSDEITIHTSGKNAALAAKMKVQIRRNGDALDLTLSHVPKNEVRVTIAIPRETSLYARMRAGDLTVDGIAGDKDVELMAGDLSIQVADATEYGPVDLSVKLGDLHGDQFGDPKGVVGNKLKQDGTGKYKLHAHVFAGDLTLKP